VINAVRATGGDVIIVENATSGVIRQLKRGKNEKTDKNDARTLWYAAKRYIEGEEWKGVNPLNMERVNALRQLRALVYAGLRAKKTVVQATNRLHQYAFSIAPQLDNHFDQWLMCVEAGYPTAPAIRYLARTTPDAQKKAGFTHHASRRVLSQLAEELPQWADGAEIAQIVQMETKALRDAQKREAELEQETHDLLMTAPFADLYRLWSTIPGSHVTALACAIVACNAVPTMYTPSQFTAAIGGQPKFNQSGNKGRKGKMNTAGFRPARAYLTLWAIQLCRNSDNPVSKAAERARRQNKPVRPRIRAKLIDLLYGVAKNKTLYDPNYHNGV
jgi:transposase